MRCMNQQDFNHPRCISQNPEHICAISQPAKVNVDFFRYDWKRFCWSIVFASGVVIGGFVAVFVFTASGPVAQPIAARD